MLFSTQMTSRMTIRLNDLLEAVLGAYDRVIDAPN